MLTWNKHLYMGNNVRKKCNQIIRRLDHQKPVANVYLLTLAANPENQLEIIRSTFLLQPVTHSICPTIVGMAKGYEEALEVLMEILEDTMRETGGTNMREYLMQR